MTQRMRMFGSFLFGGALVLAGCGGETEEGTRNTCTGDCGTAGDGDGDSNGDGLAGDFELAGCACDTTNACDGWCYCDADCENPCACDVSITCDAGCACDVGCQESMADFYPYNLCNSNQDCPGGFCAKGSCIAFCHSVYGCGGGFHCTEQNTCAYDCAADDDCWNGDANDCCVDGACVPENLCPDAAGPEGWTCHSSSYGGNDGCDCGCGLTDPDCSSPSSCDWCHAGDDLWPLCE